MRTEGSPGPSTFPEWVRHGRRPGVPVYSRRPRNRIRRSARKAIKSEIDQPSWPIERNYVFEEPVELRVSLGVVGGFEQRTEQIVDQFLKVVDQVVRAVNVAVSKQNKK